ncbi:MAG: YhcH/YjgK/YiaL family protein [Candidatus Ornithospirochaeta sp.]
MIFDTFERLGLYKSVVPYLDEVIDNLRSNDYLNLPHGEYRTEKSGILIQVQEYSTNPEARFEVHDKFADIHIMLDGREYYDGARMLSSLPPLFDSDKDIGFFDSDIETRVTLLPGTFVISLPGEPHRPRFAFDGKAEEAKKIVVKIPC